MSQPRSPDQMQVINVRIDQGTHGYYTSRDLIHQLTGADLLAPRRRYPPQPAQDKASQRLSHSSDTSIPLFSLYIRISEEHDRRKYELFKGEIDSILVFVSHFVGYLHHATSPLTTPEIIERSVLCHSCGIDYAIDCSFQ